jgi:hypothetical protein
MSALRSSPRVRRPVPDAPRVSYRVAAKAPAAHRFEVAVRVEGAPGPAAVLVLPVWTPGSYMVRDFSRHLVGGTAKDDRGRRLPVEKIRKNAWRVLHDGAAFTFSCEAFAFETTVRTAYLDAERGWFNAANLLPYLEGATDVPHEVALELPAAGRRTRRCRARPAARAAIGPRTTTPSATTRSSSASSACAASARRGDRTASR